MSLSISKLTVSKTAPEGTVVGTLTLSNAAAAPMAANFVLDANNAGFFGISGSNIVTMRANLPVGNYSVMVDAVGTKQYWDAQGSFVITVT